MFEVNGKQISHKDLNIVRDFFSDEQWDVIYDAVSEYKDFPGKEDLARETESAISQLFTASYQEIITMSCLQNETILENIYDEVWEEYRLKNNLTDDQLYTLEQNSLTGTIPEIEFETNKRFEDLCQ